MKPTINDKDWLKIKKYQGRDFSEVEDDRKAFEIISNLGSFAAYNAIIEAIAAGLSRVFVRNGRLIRLHPNGSEDVITETTLKSGTKYFHHPVTKVFHARK